jgi:membrane associated rhomboid family serine protease
MQVLQHNNATNFIIKYFGLYADLKVFSTHFYSLITYNFLHVRFFHLLFNLVVLYYIGNVFLSFFNEKQFHIYFLLGGIVGGLFFIIASNFLFNASTNVLIGASASITAILVGLATKVPNYEINIRFIGYVKLWIIALIWIAISFVSIPSANSGGQIAHLGGAFFGFIYTYLTERNLLPKWRKKNTLKTVYKKSDYGLSKHQKDRLHQQKVDYLLDKISKSGYNSLSKAEREFLARASKK